jgi:hypothetical protein
MASTSQAGEQLGSNGSFIIGGLTNPSATSTYFAWIQTYSDASCDTEVDKGTTAYYIMGGVVVTATVAESLNVSVNASTCTSFMTGTNRDSATTSIDFETVESGTFYNSCQRVDIGTNASAGYIARLHKTQMLTSAGDDVIDDGDCDGACGTSTNAVWATDNTNDGFGYCMKDRDYNGAAVADADWGTYFCEAATPHYKTISNTSIAAEPIMQSNIATTTNRAWIGYRLTISSEQPAGEYTTTLIYTVTPKY